VKKLLTSNVETKYEKALEDIVYKVFKEEWVKVLIAQGKDPEAVKKHLKEQYGKEIGKAWGKPSIESTKLRYGRKKNRRK